MNFKHLTIVLLALTASTCFAQTFTKSSTIEMTLAAGALSADAYTTYSFPKGIVEMNPVARPFVSSKVGTTAYFGTSFAGLVLANRLLRNHPRLRHTANWSLIAVEGFMAVRNSRLRPLN
jgi:hypothetical protein